MLADYGLSFFKALRVASGDILDKIIYFVQTLRNRAQSFAFFLVKWKLTIYNKT